MKFAAAVKNRFAGGQQINVFIRRNAEFSADYAQNFVKIVAFAFKIVIARIFATEKSIQRSDRKYVFYGTFNVICVGIICVVHGLVTSVRNARTGYKKSSVAPKRAARKKLSKIIEN